LAKKNQNAKRVLIVDDDVKLLEILVTFLKRSATDMDLEILTATDGAKAITIIQKTPLSLLITDLRMPMADGFKVISEVLSHFPSLPVAVMTGYGSPATESKLKDMGEFLYFEKPIDFHKFTTTILDLLNQEQGKIDTISASMFLQLLEMERTTCTLNITSGDQNGSLFIREGELVGAETGMLKGTEAALQILVWDNTHIDMKRTCRIKTPSIRMSLSELLLESYRIKDEINRDEQVVVILDEEKDSERKMGEAAAAVAGNLLVRNQVGTAAAENNILGKNNLKEVIMDIPKLNKAIDTLRENLGGALLASDIFGSDDAQSVAGWNSNPVACALFSQFTNMINKDLQEAGFPEIGRYYLLDLVDKKMVVVIPMGDYQWGMLIDGAKAQLGLVLNLAIPKAINAFEEALAG